MDVFLLNLFEKYDIGEKDAYEISQIYHLLPKDKKLNIINNFEALSIRIKEIKRDLEIEKRILIPESISRIEKAFEIARKQSKK